MCRAILVAAILSCAFAARAEALFINGNKLSENCEHWSRTIENNPLNAFNGGACGGYVTGVVDALGDSQFCLPTEPSGGVEVAQLVDVVKFTSTIILKYDI